MLWKTLWKTLTRKPLKALKIPKYKDLFVVKRERKLRNAKNDFRKICLKVSPEI
jgi:hypothetical protein